MKYIGDGVSCLYEWLFGGEIGKYSLVCVVEMFRKIYLFYVFSWSDCIVFDLLY